MMLASRVTNPSRSGLAPNPTQQLMEDSVTLTPASTASSADPLLPNTAHAPLLASIPVSQVEMTTGCPVTLNKEEASVEATIAPAFLANKSPRDPSIEECKNLRRSAITNEYLKCRVY